MDLTVGETIIYDDKGKKKVGIVKSEKKNNSTFIQILSFNHDSIDQDDLKNNFEIIQIPINSIKQKADKNLDSTLKRNLKIYLKQISSHQGGGNEDRPNNNSNNQDLRNKDLQEGGSDNVNHYRGYQYNTYPGVQYYPNVQPSVHPTPIAGQIPIQTGYSPIPGSIHRIVPTELVGESGPTSNSFGASYPAPGSYGQSTTPQVVYTPYLPGYSSGLPTTSFSNQQPSASLSSQLGNQFNFQKMNPISTTPDYSIAAGIPGQYLPKQRIPNQANNINYQNQRIDKNQYPNLNTNYNYKEGSQVYLNGQDSKIISLDGNKAKIIMDNDPEKILTVDLSQLKLKDNPGNLISSKDNDPFAEKNLKAIGDKEQVQRIIDNVRSKDEIQTQNQDKDQNKDQNTNNESKKNSQADIQDLINRIYDSNDNNKSNNLNISNQDNLSESNPFNQNNFKTDNTNSNQNKIQPEEVIDKLTNLIYNYKILREHYHKQHSRFMELCQKITKNKNNLNDFFSLASGQGNALIAGKGGIITVGQEVMYKDPKTNENKSGVTKSQDEANRTWTITPSDSPNTTITVNYHDVFLDPKTLSLQDQVNYYESAFIKMQENLNEIHHSMGEQRRILEQEWEEEKQCWEAYQKGGYILNNTNYNEFKESKKLSQIPLDKLNINSDNGIINQDNEIINRDNSPLSSNNNSSMNNMENIYLGTGLTYQIISDDSGIRLLPQTSLSKSPNYKKIEIPKDFYDNRIFSRGNQGDEIRIKYIGNVEVFKSICKELFDKNYKQTRDTSISTDSLKLYRNSWKKFKKDVEIALEGESKLEMTNSVKPFLEAKGKLHTARYIYLSNLNQQLPACLDNIQTAITNFAQNYQKETNQILQKNILSLEDNDASKISKEIIKANNNDKKSWIKKLSSYIGIGGEQELLNEIKSSDSFKSNNNNNSKSFKKTIGIHNKKSHKNI